MNDSKEIEYNIGDYVLTNKYGWQKIEDIIVDEPNIYLLLLSNGLIIRTIEIEKYKKNKSLNYIN